MTDYDYMMPSEFVEIIEGLEAENARLTAKMIEYKGLWDETGRLYVSAVKRYEPFRDALQDIADMNGAKHCVVDARELAEEALKGSK